MKKIIVFLLSLTIVFTPTLLWAGAAEKWEIVENVYDKSKNTVNVTAKKITQQAANSAVYKVQVPVSASDLGGTVKRMLWAGVAVGAVTALIEGVGWVIDEGSKVIKKPKSNDPNAPDPDFIYVDDYGNIFQNADALGRAVSSGMGILSLYHSTSCDNRGVCVLTYKKSDGQLDSYYAGVRKPRPITDPVPEPEYIPVSDSELGNEILGKGTEPNSRPDPSEDIITDAYNPNNPISDAPAPQSTNNALNNANPQPEKEPEGKSETEKEKDPETGEETGKETSKFELPNFCEWAPSVCAFFTVQKQDNKDLKENQKEDIAQNKTFFEKVSDYFDWTKNEPEKDNSDNDLPIKTPEPFDTSIFSKDRFSVSRQCPVPEQHTISLSGISVNFAFDLKPICSVLELARPALIACSYLYACYIVIGAARNG